MSFCCGASMIGTKGTLKHIRTNIHNVPILFCPVCHRVEVHYLVENEYEILAEYAHGDGASDVDFVQYIEMKDDVFLYENCVNHEQQEPLEVVQTQIDMALDLLTVSKALDDGQWEAQLKKRLQTLSNRKSKLLKKKAANGF
ncbi:hypothetical protein M5W68_00795 [Paenibacillus larvae]|uniref:hypothetical protein n=1 Tax=Paenibacillus larvae TaxID=1464 RepID=UPI00227F90C6|nr:hypothetical protein [Paenibacillus larvae]MCY9509835.1 hypothetical protein [Paenibacillus larvae]MCY9523720.1 hypothetical protein [Paenibacillus larvae]